MLLKVSSFSGVFKGILEAPRFSVQHFFSSLSCCHFFVGWAFMKRQRHCLHTRWALMGNSEARRDASQRPSRMKGKATRGH